MGEKRRKTTYRRIRADSGQQRRTGFVMALLGAAAFLPVAVRLYGLMVSSYDAYAALALRNQSRTTVVQSARGVIYDRNMNILAASKTVENVYIDPRELQQTGADVEDLARTLGELLEVEPERVQAAVGITQSNAEVPGNGLESGFWDCDQGFNDDVDVNGRPADNEHSHNHQHHPGDSSHALWLQRKGQEPAKNHQDGAGGCGCVHCLLDAHSHLRHH